MEWTLVASANTLKFGAHSIQFILSISDTISCSVNSVTDVEIWLRYFKLGTMFYKGVFDGYWPSIFAIQGDAASLAR